MDRRSSMILIAAMVWLAAGRSAGAAPPSPPSTQPATDPTAGYRLGPGPFATTSVDVELSTRAGDRRLAVKVRYPARPAGPLPVVVFSHGAGGDGNTFAELTDHWAGCGYAVLLPTHSDSVRLRIRGGERIERFDPQEVIRAVRPLERLGDVVLILDSLDTIEAKCPGLRDADGKGVLGRDRMAVAGHSAGALTAQMAIGVRTRTVNNLRPADLGDRRLKAAIVISGPGTNNRMFTARSWAGLDKPMLVITGSLDSSPWTGETPRTRQEPFALARPGAKYLLYIQGATHGSYAGRTMSALLGERPGSDIGMITGATASATVAFLDAFLVGKAEARNYLESDKIGQFSRGQAELKRK